MRASANVAASPIARSPEAIRAISFRLLDPSTTDARTAGEEDPLVEPRSITMCRSAIAATDALCVIAII